ncbi:purple acid phosphatase family protein [Micromonospora cremea]|uniref:Purple acid Phosphatase, N-terminal domain n=1 Tax=Micromonospora cremea TaxID=709881 RepID=A0A1N5TK35_9ACTN|nr:metallophosphoesterase family protein [Micromonospora cremea]SIM48409.1 Purple acid Phosphatase, N-terminal domain [Micromonospora cremea]
MPACDFTRRDLLRWTALAAAAGPLALASPARAAEADRGRPGDVLPVNLELVTLAEDHAVITWYTGLPGTDDGLGRMQPAPADGEIIYGTHPSRLNRVARGISSNTAYHYVELTGLEPGQTYYYQARSRGRAASPTPFTLISGNAVGTSPYGLDTEVGPFSFTTPQPPPGKYLFSIVLCNDLHMGETQAGLVGGQPQYIGITQELGLPPYPEVMLQALVEDVRRHKPSYLLAAGDISAEAVPSDLSRAGQLLDGFGDYGTDYFVTRGNHDRAHTGDPYSTCRVGQWQGNDCFHDGFFSRNKLTYFSRDLSGLHVIGLDTYDKPGNGGDAGALSADQLAWFRADLAKHAEQPTLVFGHHPLVMQDSAFPITAGSSLQADQATTILNDYAKTPGVFLHHAGHTHRNKRTVSPIAPNVTQMEVAAVKEYPGGYSLLRLYTGGYALNFYKSRSELARRWSERSRQEIMGYWPQFALGASVADRNMMAKHDLSHLKRPNNHPEHP